jgi:hypothetical protein
MVFKKIKKSFYILGYQLELIIKSDYLVLFFPRNMATLGHFLNEKSFV